MIGGIACFGDKGFFIQGFSGNFWEKRSGRDKYIKVVTEMRCKMLGWSELTQSGEEAELIHGGNKHSGFKIHGGFFWP